MTKHSLTLLVFLLLAAPIFAQETELVSTVNLRQEALKLKDMTRTAHRYRIEVEQLVDVREALQEATDLVVRQDAPDDTYNTIAGQWIRFNRKKAREALSNLIAAVSAQAQNAEDLNGYRQSSSVGSQIISVLAQIDPESARKIVELWPEPPASLGEEGRKALEKMQSDTINRALSAQAQISSQNYQSYIDPKQSVSQPFPVRINVASTLAASNQKEKARAVLDQGIRDLANTAPDPNRVSEYVTFFSGLWRLYPERFLESFEAFGSRYPNSDSSRDMIYEIGERKVQLTPIENMIITILRTANMQPELAAKTIGANPGLKAKLDQLGGLDQVFSSSNSLLSGQVLRTYSASLPAPASSKARRANVLPGNSTSQNAQSAVSTVTPEELLRQLRGHAETDPEWVRRKLADACVHKEHFQVLVNLATMAASVDPDLGTIALQVAGGLLSAFDTLQSRATSLRTLVTRSQIMDGAVDPGLLSEGFNLVADLREEEKQREQAGGKAVSGARHPSDDLEIYLIGQTALRDYSAALKRVRSLEDDNLRVRALIQIVQSLTANN